MIWKLFQASFWYLFLGGALIMSYVVYKLIQFIKGKLETVFAKNPKDKTKDNKYVDTNST